MKAGIVQSPQMLAQESNKPTSECSNRHRPCNKQNEGKSFECSVCGKRLSQRQHLKAHERIHTGTKYSCEHCKKSVHD